MRKFISTIIVTIITLAFIKSFVFSSQVETEVYTTDSKCNIYALDIPQNITFAGEEVPLYIEDVKERLDRELLVNTYWQSQSLLFFKRASKYFPDIENILERKGVPKDFKYLALIESGLMNVTSPAGAKGFWQLMPHTAREKGLEVNSNVDERYNFKKSTEVACNYLLKAKEKFGSWTLAAASYNMGISGLSREMKKQKVNNYYDLLLNIETARYLFRVIAVKNIYENPTKYGFHFDKDDLYSLKKTDTIYVDYSIDNLVDFAISQGVNYKELKIYNPWLKQINLKNRKGKEYLIEIPIY